MRIIRPASKGFIRIEWDDRGKEFRTVAHGKNTIMVAFIIIIIVIILLFIQPHVIYHKQSTQIGFLVALPGGKEPACQRMRLKRRGFYPWDLKILEEGMATPSSILAWRIPRTEEPGGLQSMELQRVTERLSTHAQSTQIQKNVHIKKMSPGNPFIKRSPSLLKI